MLKLKVCELQPNGDDTEDGRYKIRAPTVRDPIPEEDLPDRMDVEPEYRPKRAYMSRDLFQPEKCGYTPHCPGCLNIRRGNSKGVKHSETCRSRVEAMMREDPASAIKLERAEERINEEVMRHSEEMMEEPPPEEEPRRRRTRRTEDVGQSSKPHFGRSPAGADTRGGHRGSRRATSRVTRRGVEPMGGLRRAMMKRTTTRRGTSRRRQ